jgi:hypothetical protein
MGFEDIQKRMAKRAPRSPGLLLALAGVVLIGLNFVINEASWEHADFGGQHWTTYWPAGIGAACLLGGLIARRYPWVASRMAFALAGLGLIGVHFVLVEWSRLSAERAGWSRYWYSNLPLAGGCMLLIVSVVGIGSDLRSRSRAPGAPES